MKFAINETEKLTIEKLLDELNSTRFKFRIDLDEMLSIKIKSIEYKETKYIIEYLKINNLILDIFYDLKRMLNKHLKSTINYDNIWFEYKNDLISIIEFYINIQINISYLLYIHIIQIKQFYDYFKTLYEIISSKIIIFEFKNNNDYLYNLSKKKLKIIKNQLNIEYKKDGDLIKKLSELKVICSYDFNKKVKRNPFKLNIIYLLCLIFIVLILCINIKV